MCYGKVAKVSHICLVEVGLRIYLAKMLALKLLFLGPYNDSLLVITHLMMRMHSNETLKCNNSSEE